MQKGICLFENNGHAKRVLGGIAFTPVGFLLSSYTPTGLLFKGEEADS